MSDQKTDYSVLDRTDVLSYLFHPRPEWGGSATPVSATDVLIPVEPDVAVGARFHLSEETYPNILFFHGNGEIVADYDELGPMYNQMGINFLPVDYRGYGRSTGNPTVSTMMTDCHTIFDFVSHWLKEEGYTGPLLAMGRSLGSASVLELAAAHGERISGLIIESGFAYAAPLLSLLGVDPERVGYKETEGFCNVDKIRGYTKPTLIIHAENDHIIPFSDGQALYDACSASDKTLLKIPNANHNDIFYRGLSDYLNAVKTLVGKTV